MNSDRSCDTHHVTGSILVLKANFEPFAPLKTETTWFGTQKLQVVVVHGATVARKTGRNISWFVK